MDLELPKVLYKPGHEVLVTQINNTCTMSFLDKLEKHLPREYKEVKNDPVFAKIISIHDNCLGYSARLIHSFICRMLVTDKLHELWFQFARRPLRFSMQEFYAVTGLWYKTDDAFDFSSWNDDGGFWSRLLKRKGNICIKQIMKEHMKDVRNWSRVDRIRLVYVCILAGVILARDSKAIIPHQYIKVVMDVEKFWSYPWGLRTYDLLLDSILKARDKLVDEKEKCISYVLEGLSYALQIWIMEAIPDIGKLLGKKLDTDFKEGPRCSNWKGAAKVSYENIIMLEKSFRLEDVIYPCISSNGNSDVVLAEFLWDDEVSDCRVDHLNQLIRNGADWSKHGWEFEEIGEAIPQETDADLEKDTSNDGDEVGTPIAEDSSISKSKRSKKRFPDHGAKKRKQRVLSEKSAEKVGRIDDHMETFLHGLFHSSFTALEEKLEKKFDERMNKLQNEFSQLKESLKQGAATTDNCKPSTTSNPATEFKSPPEKVTSEVDVNLGTQEFLQKAMNGLSQDTFTSSFDPTQPSGLPKPVDWWTPMTSMRSDRVDPLAEATRSPSPKKMKRTPWRELKLNDDDVSDDCPLTSIPGDEWDKFQDWGINKTILKVGPSVYDIDAAYRVMGPRTWLGNEDIDAVMFLFRENTSLRR